MTPREVAQTAGLSEAATVSVLSILAQEGRIRICLVSLAHSARAPASDEIALRDNEVVEL